MLFIIITPDKLYINLKRFIMDNKKEDFNIEKIISDHKVLLDISSVTHKSAKGFFTEYFAELLKKNGNKLIIPFKLIENLRKESTNEISSDKSKKALTLIKFFISEKIADVVGNGNDPELPDLFRKLSIDLTYKYDICLITQNRALVKSIYKLRKSVGETGKKQFTAFRIKNKTTVEELVTDNVGRIKSLSDNANSKSLKEPIKSFKLCKKPINFDRKDYLKISSLPSLHDRVKTDKNSNNMNYHKLIKEIGRGGEGAVYLTDTGFACKIYKKTKLTGLKRDKILLMLSNPVLHKGICWPISMVYNSNNEFVGYLMNRASGKELQKTIFIKPLLFKTFPAWTRLNLLTLCINILGIIQYLHKRNIIIGDINPLNILVNNENEIYFVDTDSYQIENYPCPVGTVNYTPPELQGKDYKRILRTFEQEYFAVATLIFMILLPGKPPYSRRGGSDPATNIKNTEFSYPYGKDRKKKLRMVHGNLFGVICPAT